jgi:hypothetical protein
MASRRPVPCESVALPHAYAYARPYVIGWRCPRHTPAAEAGRPETPPGPGWPSRRDPDAPPWTPPSRSGPNPFRLPLPR